MPRTAFHRGGGTPRRDRVRRHRIELVQAFLPNFDILAPCLRFTLPRLVIVTSRRTMDDRLPRRQPRLIKATAPLVRAVVANSNARRQRAILVVPPAETVL